MRTVTKSNTKRDFFSFMSKRRKHADVLPVLAQEHFTYGMYMTVLIRSLDVNTIFFRRSIAFVIALVVTSRSCSFEYTISVHIHAVHAGAENNVCNIVVSIHFKYILAGRQDLILTSVAHLRKRLS